MKKKSNVFIIGASGLGREIESWVSLSKDFNDRYIIKGYIDINPNGLDGYPSDYKVLGNDDFQFNPKDFVLLGIADPEIKESLVNRLKDKVRFLSFVFDNAILGKFNEIGEGTIIAPDCVISTNCAIGKFVTINLGAKIGHDSIISDFSSIFGHVILSGKTKIGKSVFIGSQSTIFPGIEVGANSKISAGSIVSKNIKENSLVFGNPPKVTSFYN